MPDTLARLTAALADRYAIQEELGAGGMATVYLAEDLKHQRKVAVKVLRPELAAVLGAERFLKEIETAANLQHPHILPLFDSGEADGMLYYVMPYVEGESLADRLKREKQQPLEDALEIACEVASALGYAHTSPLPHPSGRREGGSGSAGCLPLRPDQLLKGGMILEKSPKKWRLIMNCHDWPTLAHSLSKERG